MSPISLNAEGLSNQKLLFDNLLLQNFPQKACLLIGNGIDIHFLTKDIQNKTQKESAISSLKWDAILKAVSMSPTEKQCDLSFMNGNLSDIEKAYFLRQIKFSDSKKEFNKALKDVIETKLVINWKETKRCGLLDFAYEHNYHILNLNFDENLEQYFKFFSRKGEQWDYVTRKFDKPCSIKNDKTSSRSFTQESKGRIFWKRNNYGWNKYFTRIDTPKVASGEKQADFGIWHIHGRAMSGNGSSVLFSSKEYCNAISYFRNLSSRISKEKWEGSKTWLKLFFECPLVIVGVGLTFQETLLRHLLCIRKE